MEEEKKDTRRSDMDIKMDSLSEQLQANLLTYFDGFPDRVLSELCQMVYDTVKAYK